MSASQKSHGTSLKPPASIGREPVFIEVVETHAGQRLDNYLISLLKGVPKSHIYRIIRKGEVRINRGRVKQTTRLAEGDVLRVPPIRLGDRPATTISKSKYAFLNDAILFEDDAIIVLNKPSGMAVHSGSGVSIGIIEAMRALRTDLSYLELAHRLDRETSGCLVLAKKMSVLRKLNADFASNSMSHKKLSKRYLALVGGYWRFGERKVTKALNTDSRRSGERYVTVSASGSHACSIMRPLQRCKTASLLQVELLTGRTHQVRVHAQAEGHPIAGDQRYGSEEFNTVMLKKYQLRRLFLHASEIRFAHPISEQVVAVEAPLPTELQAVVDDLPMASA